MFKGIKEYKRGDKAHLVSYTGQGIELENCITKKAFVYSLSMDLHANEDGGCKITVVFSKLKQRDLNRLKGQFAKGAHPFLHALSRALMFDVDFLPKFFNDQTIEVFRNSDNEPFQAFIYQANSNEPKAQYIFDL